MGSAIGLKERKKRENEGRNDYGSEEGAWERKGRESM